MTLNTNTVTQTDLHGQEAKKPTPIRPSQLSKEQLDLLSFDANHTGNAEAVMYLYGDKIKYTESLGWLVWDDRQWRRDKQVVKLLVADTLDQRKHAAALAKNAEVEKRSSADVGNVSGTMHMLEALASTETEFFDSRDDLLPAPNGVIDLRTGKLLEHDAALGTKELLAIPDSWRGIPNVHEPLVQVW